MKHLAPHRQNIEVYVSGHNSTVWLMGLSRTIASWWSEQSFNV